MTTNISLLRQLPPKNVRELLEQIVAQNEDHAQARPCLSFYLRSGSIIKGQLINLHCKGRTCHCTIHVSGCERSSHADLMYINVSKIHAVIVHDATLHAQLLSFGALTWDPTVSPPTHLELRRRAAAILAQQPDLQTVIQLRLEGDGEDLEKRRMLSLALDALEAALQEITGDKLGHEALSTVEKITIQLAPTFGVTRVGRTITVTFKVDEAPPTIEMLQTKLSELL